MFSEKTTFTFPIILSPIKDISIQIHSFSTLFVRTCRYFVNEFLSLSILNLFRISILYLEISTLYTVWYSLFPVRSECTHVLIYEKIWFVYIWRNLFTATLERSLWTLLLNQH